MNLEVRKPRPGGGTRLAANDSTKPDSTWTADEQRLHQQLQNGETVVINLRKDAHRNLALWAAQQQRLIYIGRPGWALAAFNRHLTDHRQPHIADAPWANPYVVGRDGDRDEVIAKYAENRRNFKRSCDELQGKALGCWCAPAPCHGDILKLWAEGGAS